MSFDAISLARLSTCHPELREIALAADTIVPHRIVCGARTKDEQEAAFASGNSKKHYPAGKHCVGDEAGRLLSDAIDFAPFEQDKAIDWKQSAHFTYLNGIYMGLAKAMGIPLRSGCDWNQNGILQDEELKDLGHVERV